MNGHHVKGFFKQGPGGGCHRVQLGVQLSVFGVLALALSAVVFESAQLTDQFRHMPWAFTQDLSGDVDHPLQHRI